MTKLIILRGNSGSGKTTIANAIRQSTSKKVMIVSQDTLRREVLDLHDSHDFNAAELIALVAKYAIEKYDVVVVEGILSKKYYRDMLYDLISCFGDSSLVYYFDIPFETTLSAII